MADRLTTYAELAAMLDSLPMLLREARRAQHLNLRDAADQIGVSFNSLSRFERGRDMMLGNAIAVLRWLDHPPETPDA